MGILVAEKLVEDREAQLNKGLRALDPDLPLIAARAAIQLDLVISAARSREAPNQLRTDAIQQLATMLSGVSTAGNDASYRGLADPLTANLLSKAYSEASHAQLHTLRELEVAMQKVAKTMDEATKQEAGRADPLQGLVLLRDFCVKLSEYAASKRQLAFGERPVPPYRR